MLLVLDNYDSFVHNLARYFRRLGQATRVVRSDCCTIEDIDRWQPSGIIISPGPKSPAEAGISLQAIRHFSGKIPIFGVCLGHQAIAAAWGAAIVRNEPMHGRQSLIEHDACRIFKNTPSPLPVARYHSLVIRPDSLPSCLRVTAKTHDGTIMAIEHTEHLTFGVQFHPESILTEYGLALLMNFLELSGIEHSAAAPALDRISSR